MVAANRCWADKLGGMRDTVSVNVRIPKELHERLAERSLQDRRSLNSEILWLLETALAIKKDVRATKEQRRD